MEKQWNVRMTTRLDINSNDDDQIPMSVSKKREKEALGYLTLKPLGIFRIYGAFVQHLSPTKQLKV